MSQPLPKDVTAAIEYLARWAKGYDNHLKWDEKAKFKADLMNARARWIGIDLDLFRRGCIEAGMRAVDVQELVDWLAKAQAGRRLVSARSYRRHTFGPIGPRDL